MRRHAIAALLLLAATAPPAERIVAGDGIVDATVNGLPLRLRIEPGAPGLPLVSQAFAARAGLKCGGLLCFGVAYGVGRENAYGKTVVARFGWGANKAEKRRVGWLSRDYAMPADGAIGPAGLPEPVVRFALRPPRTGERTVALPLERGGLFSDWGASRAVLTVGAEKILVRFDPDHRRSLATAAAGVALARAQGGVLTAERGTQEVRFGIERPYRVLTLERPLAVGPVTLASLGVRVTEGGGANTIPQEGDDPSEVVVTAKGKKTGMVLSLGADALGRCSAIVFDKPAKLVRLTCA